MSTPVDRLEAARRRIDDLDSELVRVATERVAAAADAGRAKAEMGQSLVDFRREREVLDRVRQAASDSGLDPAVAEDVVTRLILASTSRQERERVTTSRSGAGRVAVVVGGAGRMGGWLMQFLQGLGYRALVLDPRANPETTQDAARHLATAHLVLVAVPPSEAARLYAAWVEKPPQGIVADVCSVKTPLLEPLRRLRQAGGKVTSFHPMFGPSTTVLRGNDVVVCRTGDRAADEAVRDLFAATSARLVDVDLEEHDRWMADVLGLAHATAIAFALGVRAPPPMQGTTFSRLRDVAVSVLGESAQVYYEIQAGNPHTDDSLKHLQDSVDRLRATIQRRDADGFRGLLDEGHGHLEAPSP